MEAINLQKNVAWPHRLEYQESNFFQLHSLRGVIIIFFWNGTRAHRCQSINRSTALRTVNSPNGCIYACAYIEKMHRVARNSKNCFPNGNSISMQCVWPICLSWLSHTGRTWIWKYWTLQPHSCLTSSIWHYTLMEHRTGTFLWPITDSSFMWCLIYRTHASWVICWLDFELEVSIFGVNWSSTPSTSWLFTPLVTRRNE